MSAPVRVVTQVVSAFTIVGTDILIDAALQISRAVARLDPTKQELALRVSVMARMEPLPHAPCGKMGVLVILERSAIGDVEHVDKK